MHNNRDRRKNSTYRLTFEPATVRRDDGAFVPVTAPEYVDWLAEGNTPAPIEKDDGG